MTTPSKRARAQKPALARFSISLPDALSERVRELAYTERVSVSAIIESALNDLFGKSGAAISRALDRDNAGLRRRLPETPSKRTR